MYEKGYFMLRIFAAVDSALNKNNGNAGSYRLRHKYRVRGEESDERREKENSESANEENRRKENGIETKIPQQRGYPETRPT